MPGVIQGPLKRPRLPHKDLPFWRKSFSRSTLIKRKGGFLVVVFQQEQQ